MKKRGVQKTVIRRTYSGEADLKLLQDFNAAAIAVTDHCGYLHPGDIPHHLYNGNRYYDPTEVMTIWEDDQGVAAWLLVGPGHKTYTAQVRPDLRAGDVRGFAGAVDRNGHRHILHLELVDRFHTQFGEDDHISRIDRILAQARDGCCLFQEGTGLY